MKMSEKITLSMVAVVGPRLVLTSIWHSNKSDIDASRRVGGTSPADADERMSQAARNGVCSQARLSAFVRLGGQVQYVYKSEDGHVVLAPVVTAC